MEAGLFLAEIRLLQEAEQPGQMQQTKWALWEIGTRKKVSVLSGGQLFFSILSWDFCQEVNGYTEYLKVLQEKNGNMCN